jgi:hypothetical protein
VRTPGYYLLAIGRVLQAVALSERARTLPPADRACVIEELDNTCLELRHAHTFLRGNTGKLRTVSGQSTAVVDHQMVDMMAVLRASQALSSQTSPGQRVRQDAGRWPRQVAGIELVPAL